MPRSMNILMTLFTRRYEGTFYRAFPWASYLASCGHNVTLLCTSRDKRFTKTVSTESGVRIIETPSLLEGRRVMTRMCGMYGWGPLDIATRLHEIRTGDYQIIHAFEHHMHVALPLYLAGRQHMPVLIADWCDHYGKGGFREFEYSPYRLHRLYDVIGTPFKKLMDFLERDLRYRADAVTVISSFLKQRAIDFGVEPKKVHLIPGSADVSMVTPRPQAETRTKLNLNPHGHYVLFFGAGQFDLDFSLDAFELILKQLPDTRFIVVGKKDEGVTRKAESLGVLDNVIQTGWVDDDQLNDWLACTDVCLLPMKNNPPNLARWPNKIGSYMAAARPTVLTGVNDAGQLVEREQIGLVTKVDIIDFADKTLQLLNDKLQARALGERARQVAEKQYALPIHGNEIEQLYLNLLETRDDP